MSAIPTPRSRTQFHTPIKKRSLIIEDLAAPNLVRPPITPSEAQAQNRGFMAVRASLGRRVNMRMDWEITVPWACKRTYKRMRCVSVLLSCPNQEQAELFIQAMHDFAGSLNGKWLAPKPEQPAPEDEQPIRS